VLLSLIKFSSERAILLFTFTFIACYFVNAPSFKQRMIRIRHLLTVNVISKRNNISTYIVSIAAIH